MKLATFMILTISKCTNNQNNLLQYRVTSIPDTWLYAVLQINGGGRAYFFKIFVPLACVCVHVCEPGLV